MAAERGAWGMGAGRVKGEDEEQRKLSSTLVWLVLRECRPSL